MTGTGGSQGASERSNASYIRLLGGVIAVGFACLLGLQLFLARQGLDLLDESYNLSLAAQPEAAKTAGDVFLFGYLLHPLYLVSGADIATYRALGIGIVVLASGWMTAEVFGVLAVRGWRVSRLLQALVGLAVAASTIPALPRSLGYRSVALVGLMLAVVGLARTTRGTPFSGGMVAGVAVAITFTGKPTSAALLVVLIGLYVLAERVTLTALSGAILGVSVGGLVLLGLSRMWVPDLVSFLSRGYGQLRQYDSYSSVWDLVGLGFLRDVDTLRAAAILGGFVVVPGALLWALLGRLQPRTRMIGGFAGVAAGTAVALVIVLRVSRQGLGNQVEPLTLVIPIAAAALVALRLASRRGQSPTDAVPGVPWRLLAVLTLMPYIYAIGTNTLFSYAMAQAAVFWTLFLALSAIIGSAGGSRRPEDAAVVLSMSIVLSVIALVVVAGRLNQGYAGGNFSTDVPVAGGTLMLPRDDARALHVISEVRRVHSLDTATPSMDLTGIFPGYQFELGTRPLGRPSYYGFFAGAEAAARFGLSNVSCADRGRAWLLYAKDNPDDISDAFTAGVLDLAADYDQVASFEASQGPASWRSLTVQILRPHADVPRKLGC